MAIITKDMLLERLSQMEDAKDRALADANAAHGAIVVLQEMIAKLDEEDVEDDNAL